MGGLGPGCWDSCLSSRPLPHSWELSPLLCPPQGHSLDRARHLLWASPPAQSCAVGSCLSQGSLQPCWPACREALCARPPVWAPSLGGGTVSSDLGPSPRRPQARGRGGGLSWDSGQEGRGRRDWGADLCQLGLSLKDDKVPTRGGWRRSSPAKGTAGRDREDRQTQQDSQE